MERVCVLVVACFLLAASPAPAHPYTHLSKDHARAAGYKYVAPIIDLLDLDRTVTTHMVRAGRCHRVSARTIDCYFWADLAATHERVAGNLRVHLQRDGLLGFLLPFDPWDFMVPASGEPAGS